MSYGPETVALADAIRHSALYQRAVSDGHTPTDEEVSDYRDRDRQRSEGGLDFFELARLAKKSDMAGFKALAEQSQHPDIQSILETASLSEFMASMEHLDLRGFEKSLQEREAFLESVGRERYWNKIYPDELRRDLSADILEQAVIDASIDGPWEIPGLAWLSYRRETLSRISVELTSAAPPDANVDGALVYLAELLEMEGRSLVEEYERRRKR